MPNYSLYKSWEGKVTLPPGFSAAGIAAGHAVLEGQSWEVAQPRKHPEMLNELLFPAPPLEPC